jgi:hypothetical protein
MAQYERLKNPAQGALLLDRVSEGQEIDGIARLDARWRPVVVAEGDLQLGDEMFDEGKDESLVRGEVEFSVFSKDGNAFLRMGMLF